ncbi:MAG: YbbR-like domain-containing protein [Bacilli bacterium]
MKRLKKIIKAIKKFFLGIFNFIDRVIVTPVTKFGLFLGEKTDKNAGKFEKWLNKKNTLVFISLFMALLLFFYVDNQASTVIDSAAEVLHNQTVEATYNKEAYVVEGIPETADVTLIGRTVDLYLAKQLSTGKVSVDLSNLKEGTHKVDLSYESSINSVTYKLDPSSITVNVYPKVSQTKTVTIDVINKDKLDSKLSVQSVTLDKEEVIIKGTDDEKSSHNINKVATVKALVDVGSIVDSKAGVNTVDKVKLVAYDKYGNVVDVEIVPETVTATVNIESYSGTAKLKVIPKNIDKISFGKAISSITTSVNEISIYGDQETVNKYSESYIPIEVDVAGLTDNKTYTIVVPKPEGIREVSEKTITVKISIGKEESKEVDDIKIDAINLGPNLKAGAIGENSSKTTVVVKGTKEVLDAIDSTTIKATVDLSGLGEGEHTVNVKVSGEEVKANYFAKTTKIKVRITKS